MSPELSPHTLRAVARIATESGRNVRFAMRGGSMLPLLREPMILDVAPIAGRCEIGDVIVFTLGQIVAAHRVIGYDGEHYVTSGDAQPHIVEKVRPLAVLGRVESVWEDASPSGRRVDIGLNRLRGCWYARAQPLRARAFQARALAVNVLRRLTRVVRRHR